MKEYTLELRFLISDPNCSPESISEVLGLQPDRAFHLGERISDPPMPKTNVWQLTSTASPVNSTTREQWEGLRSRLDAIKDGLQLLPNIKKKQLTLVLFAYEYMPYIDFEIDILQQIVEFGVPLKISIYDLVEEDEGL